MLRGAGKNEVRVAGLKNTTGAIMKNPLFNK